MSDEGGEINVEYLARLFLQFENSPFLLDTNLVRCQDSLPLVCCADASIICIAWGRRIVVIPTHAHTHPLLFAAAVTPSTREMVTSMCCIRVPGSMDAIVLVGTSDGYFQVHHPTGDVRGDQRRLTCIHRQRVHVKALLHLSMACDSSTVCMTSTDGIIVVDVIEILSLRQWWLKGGQETAELGIHAYETYTVGQREATVILSHRDYYPEASLYEDLVTANKRPQGARVQSSGGTVGSVQGPGLNTAMAMSIGRGPPIAWFKLDRRIQPKGVISSIIDMSTKMLFGRAQGESHAGIHVRDASRAGSGTHVIERPDEVIDRSKEGSLSKKDKRKLRGKLASPLAGVWDEDKRGCFGLVCWRDTWAACCDTLGRVIVIDICHKCVVKMIKGYRDCHLAWSAGDGAGSKVLLLIYAPKRRSLELWDVCAGGHTPVARMGVTGTGILIPSDAGLAFLFDYGCMRVLPITGERFRSSPSPGER